MKSSKLSNSEFNPGIIFCNNFIQGMTMDKGFKLDSRNIYDYELELITDSDEGYMVQNGKRVDVKRGDIIFRSPGESTQGIMRYSSYIICFELQMNTRHFDVAYDLMQPKSYQEKRRHCLVDTLPSMFHTNHYGYYIARFKEILDCYMDPEEATQNYLGSLVVHMLYRLNHEVKNVVNNTHKKAEEIKKVLRYIEANIQQPLSLEELSEQAHLSPVYFHQVFTKIMEMTPRHFVIQRRIALAKEQLIHSDMTVKEIGYMVGYNDTSYFCHAFKKQTGYSPVSFRERHQFTFIG